MTTLAVLGNGSMALAQECRPPSSEQEWVRVCGSGNGVPLLSTQVRLRGDSLSVRRAIELVARQLGTALRFESTAAEHDLVIATDTVTRSAGLMLAMLSYHTGVSVETNAAGSLRVRSRAAVTLSAITVRATRAEAVIERVGTTSTTMQELARTPIIVAPDVLRMIRLLPGVSVRNDFSLDFNVRGGESAQSLVLIDGYPIYNPFHLGGVLGTFIEPAVGTVELQAGAFPTGESGRLSGLLTAHTRRDVRPGSHGGGDVSLLASTAALSHRTSSGRTYWLLGARRTYADAVVAAFGHEMPYYFQDAHAYVEHAIGEHHLISATNVYSADRLHGTREFTEARLGWGNHVLGTTLRGSYANLWRMDSVIAVHRASRSVFDGYMMTIDRDLEFTTHVTDARLSTAATMYTGPQSHEAGMELAQIGTHYSGDAPNHWLRNLLLVGTTTSSQSSLGAWYAYSTTYRAMHVMAGFRADVVEESGAAVSPRVSMRADFSPTLALIASAGQHVQWIHSNVRQEQPFHPIDFWLGGPAVPMARAEIATLGIDRRYSDGRQLRIESFYRRYSSLTDRSSYDIPDIKGDEFERLHGTTKGFDLLLRPRTSSRIQGWLAYTYASSIRIDSRGVRFTPAHDRRHELNVVAMRQLGAWSGSARLNLASGTPYTPLYATFVQEPYDPGSNSPVNQLDGEFRDPTQYISGMRNSARLPMAHRLDLGVARTGTTGDARAVPYLSLANAYGAFNPYMIFDSRGSGASTRTSVAGFRFLPTVGLRFVY